jgi:hypothetical protein
MTGCVGCADRVQDGIKLDGCAGHRIFQNQKEIMRNKKEHIEQGREHRNKQMATQDLAVQHLKP